MDPELACIWTVIGKGKSKWLIGQLYREHMILGDKGSASVERQKDYEKKKTNKTKKEKSSMCIACEPEGAKIGAPYPLF